ncbi:MAG: SH3 domain-containing protein [Gemmatimonadales bacterium]|nr:SH3 domain-containing protein [Gemmatimonadales bacterium]
MAFYQRRAHLRGISRIAVFSVAAFVAVGCSKGSPQAVTTPEPVIVTAPPDTVVQTVTVTDPELEQRNATLQLRLLERDAQIKDLQQKLDQADREVVRTMAKLQSSASRAEAASARAEAEIALEELKASRAMGSPAVSQTERLLAMSTVEFDRQNYSGSLYLAGRARAIARQRGGPGGGIEESTTAAGEVRFTLPLQLEAVKRSNVRERPDLESKVLFTVDQGSRLVGYSFVGNWVRVSDDQGRRGWIFHTLVTSRQESAP